MTHQTNSGKKYTVPDTDKEDWESFTENIGEITTKEVDLIKPQINTQKIKKLDLHGCSLLDANKKVEKFINQSYEYGYIKILIVTGKGSRSKSYHNPYISKEFSILKDSIPEYIKNDENLSKKILKISSAEVKDGGNGAIYVFLKNKNKL